MKKAVLFFVNVILIANVSAQCPNSSRAGIHVVQPGEGLYRISKMYGISLADICNWNNISVSTPLSICMELKVAAPTTSQETTVLEFIERKATVPGQTTHVVQPGESISSIAEQYGYTEKRFRRINGLPDHIEFVAPGSVLLTSDCVCPVLDSQKAAVKDEFRDKKAEVPQSYNTSSANYAEEWLAAYYMSEDERSIAQRINDLRINPRAFATKVEKYLATLDALSNPELFKAANELIDNLRNTPPMPALRPSSCLYDAGVEHGAHQRRIGQLSHQDGQGRWTFERLTTGCSEFFNADENIIGGTNDAESALMSLLIDADDADRRHRRNFLNPQWRYLTTHHIGTVGQYQNTWLFAFAQ